MKLSDYTLCTNCADGLHALCASHNADLQAETHESCGCVVCHPHAVDAPHYRAHLAAVELGRRGGLANKGVTSRAKARTARINGRKGGRPKKTE